MAETYRNVCALILVSISKIKLGTQLGPASSCLPTIKEARESYAIQSREPQKDTLYRNSPEIATTRFQLSITLLSFVLYTIQPNLIALYAESGHCGLRCINEENSLGNSHL